MTQKLMTFKGGKLGSGSSTPVTHEEKPEVPIISPIFERNYAPEPEAGPEQVELPRTVKEQKEQMDNLPGSKVGEQTKTKMEQEWDNLQAEIDAKWSEGGQV